MKRYNQSEDESLLIKAFGNSPKLRIIDFFLDNKLFDFSKKEIIEGAHLSRTTFFKVWDEIEKLGIVEVSRSFGKTKLYRLNKKSDIIEKLLAIESSLIESSANEVKIPVKIGT